jgi:uncharacterized membrane protein YtjA (UPF0391 family)
LLKTVLQRSINGTSGTIFTNAEDSGSRRLDMLGWTITFLIIALVAAAFGFGGIAVAAAGIAKILFFVFLVLFLVSLLSGLMRRA